ncbi:hypothetical protein ACWGJB_04570 [Streptomyces sp. NPDC054813]
MSTEARHAPIPRRPSPDPAPTSDDAADGAAGQGAAPGTADASGRTDGPGFFDRPNRVNWSHRSDVSTGSADATGQDQLPGRPDAQQSREDRTSRGGAVAQGEQGAGDQAAARPATAERITRPRYPDLRPPQSPPPASARFPDTPPTTSARETDRTTPSTASAGQPARPAPPASPGREDGGITPPGASGWESGRSVPPGSAGREDRRAESSVSRGEDRRNERSASPGREGGRWTQPRSPYGPGLSDRRPESASESTASLRPVRVVEEPEASPDGRQGAAGPASAGERAGGSSGVPGARRPERPRSDFSASFGAPESGTAWSPHMRTFPVPTAPPRPGTPPKATPPPRPAKPPTPTAPPLPPRPTTPPAPAAAPPAGDTASSMYGPGPVPDPAMSWTAAAGTPGRDRPVVTFGEPEGYDERGWGRSLVSRLAPRTAAAAACMVLGLGLIGGAVTGSWIVDDDGDLAAASSFSSAAGLWHDVPVDELFPPTVQGTGAGPGGADRTWTRIAVAPATGCAHAFDPLLRKTLAPVGCQRLIRATYTDATQSYVTTVGLLFTKAEPAGMTALAKRFEDEHLDRRTDLMPLPYAAKGTAAERFGRHQRASWTISVLTDAPVVAYAVSGWADGRTVDTPQSAADAEASGATTAAAQAGLGNEAQGLADRIERRLRQNTAGSATEKPS